MIKKKAVDLEINDILICDNDIIRVESVTPFDLTGANSYHEGVLISGKVIGEFVPMGRKTRMGKIFKVACDLTAIVEVAND